MPPSPRGTVRVRAPATSANLGSGFDCLGLALDLWNEVTAVALDDSRPREENLIHEAARAVFAQAGEPYPGFDLACTNRVPFGRGLGSSAAAISCGVLLANAYLGGPLSEADVLRLASRLEGHPDNVVPCMLGGVRVSLVDDSGCLRQSVVPRAVALRAVVFVPELPVPTHVARGRLPSSVPLQDAVFNVARSSLLVAALATGDLSLLAEATRDRLHQPYRMELFPAAAALHRAALEAGAVAAYTSGAGPSVLALCPDDDVITRVVSSSLVEAASSAHVVGTTLTLGLWSEVRTLSESALLVQKYGGSSLATAERITAAARRIAATARDGRPVIVVVSAMGDTTDELIELAYSVARRPDERELDLLLSTGETVSATLMAMALHAMETPAVSLTGAQAGIRSTKVFSRARITDIHPERIRAEVAGGKIVIVTGFQGVTDDQDVTTLGRGGSDTTAVALACALDAERCEIYTDVEGIFTADPRLVPGARKLSEIDYDEMLELAQLGARVMHPRAVELGELYDLPILVASSFSDEPGTLIHRVAADGGAAMPMEIRRNVRGIAHDTDVARITLVRVPDRPGVAAAVFQPLADANISVDTIAQSSGADGTTDISFTVSRDSLTRALELTQVQATRIGAESVDPADDLAKVSIVGTGMQSAPGYAARMFGTLAEHGINIAIISTSDIRITCVVPRTQVEDAVRALHTAFELDQD